ncbi:MAG TPA: proton-conducting transporter membrane subunit [Candidatus Eisenbacteria bacterium]|nr:proton-conducting transporter membrane subunit [Candidatus Eisenbacteria bacterium]
MAILLAALGAPLLGGLGALLVRGSWRWATAFGVGGVVLGSLVALVPTVAALLGAPVLALSLPWDVPFGAFAVGLDALSALFVLPVLVLSTVAAVYGGGYLRAHHGDDESPGTSWFFFGLLVASMELVLVARNAVLFLVAWEIMALASFFLVTADDRDASVREAGFTYLVATHLGTAFLIAMFVLLGGGADPMNFDHFPHVTNVGAIVLLALVGFGTKAGFMPLHVWLPEAHPAAPSYVSAVMSGVMIKTGIYGLVRVLTLVGPLPGWCGWLLVAVGAASGVLGILSALAQQDVKRILAYSSIENVGIITLALGLGLVGLRAGANDVAVLSFAAAFLHVLNHAVTKGLLFLGVGAVVQQTGTRRLDTLGGLLRRLPRTGLACFVGSAAIAGLPPFGAFASEFLLYVAAYRAILALSGARALPAAATIGALALIGGLAAACFAKLFGIAFLGEPRSEQADRAREPGRAMQSGVVVLAAGCIILGVASPLVVRSLEPVLTQVTALPHDAVDGELVVAVTALSAVVASCVAFAIVAGGLAALRRRLLAGRAVTAGPTWDCGYAAPSPRMQYTGSSFSQPLTTVFARVLRVESGGAAPKGFFPARASFASATPDVAREGLYRPVFGGVRRALGSLRWLQHGEVQLYVLYVALTLIALLVWKIGPG